MSNTSSLNVLPEGNAPSTDTGQGIDRDYPLVPVPASDRRSMSSLLILLFGFIFFGPTMIAGGQIAVNFAFGEFLLWAGVAVCVLAAYISALAVISARTGLSTVLLCRRLLGVAGGKWAGIVLGGTQVGWYGVTIAVLGNLLGQALGLDQVWPIVVVFGVLMGASAYFGYRGLEILSWISVPLMLVLCVWVTNRALDETGGWSALMQAGGDTTISVGAALTIMIGTFISGGTQVGNWSRFARSGRAALLATAGAVLSCQSLMLFFGGIGASAYGEPDFAVVLIQMGLLGVGLALLVVNLWTTNDNAAYAFGVAGAELFRVGNKRPFIVIGVILGIIIAVTGIYESLETFLVVLGVVIPPLGGALIGQYFLVHKASLPDEDANPPLRWGCFAAYLLGTLAAVLGTTFDLGVPAVQGIVVAIAAAPAAAWVSSAFGAKRLPERV
ncbi:cytosine permease [Nocardiopsis sp. NPDC006938]|uniref:cytosine permease n=1 Tax=Nocardiopsis sp. NPDC006938 TaxID=3364337 RepID=UPI0036A11838